MEEKSGCFDRHFLTNSSFAAAHTAALQFWSAFEHGKSPSALLREEGGIYKVEFLPQYGAKLHRWELKINSKVIGYPKTSFSLFISLLMTVIFKLLVT